MEARSVDELPRDGAWQFEPKWDGFRCLGFKNGKSVELRAKSGKPLTRYFPEVAAALAAISVERFILDGELLVPVRQSISFDSLQARLHPAQSRINKLSTDTPAIYILFDILTDGRSDLASASLGERRTALEAFFARPNKMLRYGFRRSAAVEKTRWPG